MKISDSHNDFLTFYKTKQSKKNYLYRLTYTNLKILNAVFWTSKTKNPIKELYKNASIISEFKQKNIKIIYSIEDVGFCDIKNISDLIKANVSFCGLVWNYNNKFGGGALDDGCLTPLGIKILKELEKNNICVDTAHMNEKTFKDFIKITSKPIYNSHSNIFDLCEHKRNLKGWQISKIIKSNGYLGLSFVNDFITKNGTSNVQEIARQIMYFINKWGSDNVGLGTDFFGTSNLPQNLKSYADIKNLEKELFSLGISENITNKILYQNYYDFLKRLNKL